VTLRQNSAWIETVGTTEQPFPAARAARVAEAVNRLAQRLLGPAGGAPTDDEIVAVLGEASGAARAVLWRVTSSRPDLFPWVQRAGWEAELGSRTLAPAVDLARIDEGRWLESLRRDQLVHGLDARWPDAEPDERGAGQPGLLVAAPIQVQGELWACLLLESFPDAPEWPAEVLANVHLASRLIGAARERNDLRSDQARALRRYEELLENINDVVVRVRLDGSWGYLSSSWERMSGLPVDAALGRPWQDFFVPEDHACLQYLLEGFRTGHALDARVEVRLSQPGDGIRWVIVNVRRVSEEGTEGFDLAGTLTDIHAAKLAERELTQARQQAEAANRAKSDFLSTMSHELRTPLNAVIGLADALREPEGVVDLERRQRYLSLIHQSGRQLLAMVNDILELARLDVGQASFKPDWLPLSPLCRNVVEQLRDEAAVRAINVDVHVEPALRAWFDGRLVRLALHNLVGNAIKFTRRGGRVTLEARESGEGGVELAVTDTGIGIAADDLPRLFMPFTQIDSSLNRSFGGTGLGLTLVDRIARLHGGRVSVVSAPTQGSCFRLLLPGRTT
jgi:PAS domain S-box-containing protein